MYTTLEKCLSEVTDPRRAQGKRISISQLFGIILISNLCGHLGGRPISRFAIIHKDSFIKNLNLKHNIPSHVTISDFINRVDQQEMIDAFNQWTSTSIPLEKGDSLSGDGKALGSTVSNSSNSQQDFQAVVSLFCHHSGLVYALERYHNKKESEIGVVQFLIEKLEQMGLTFFLDALHCQKNSRNDCRKQ